jgi:hypothetical protein
VVVSRFPVRYAKSDCWSSVSEDIQDAKMALGRPTWPSPQTRHEHRHPSGRWQLLLLLAVRLVAVATADAAGPPRPMWRQIPPVDKLSPTGRN